MNHHVDFFRRQIKQPASFDYLQCFVEHGGRVDGDLISHPPGGVIEDVGERGTLNLLQRRIPKWPTTGGKDHPSYLIDAPALHRLEKQGWVKSVWKQTDNNQRAKFYGLTAAGRKQLASEQQRWDQMTTAIAGLLNRGEA